jgi:hypothetical protein
MLASLFDNIGLRSLFAALLVSAALLALCWWPELPYPEAGLSGLADWGAAARKGLGFGVLFLGALIFNEFLNRRRIFDGSYHFMPLMAALASGLVLLPGADAGWLYLPVHLILIYRLLDLQRTADARYLYFDLGWITGLAGFAEAQFWFYLPLGWLLGLLVRHAHGRNFAASLLGWAAMVFLVGALGDFTGYDGWGQLQRQAQSLSITFGLSLPTWQSYHVLLGALLLLLLVQFPQRLQRANAAQRQTFQFWYLMVLYGWLGYLFLGRPASWAGLWLVTTAWALAALVSHLQNRWLRMALYLAVWLVPVLALLAVI